MRVSLCLEKPTTKSQEGGGKRGFRGRSATPPENKARAPLSQPRARMNEAHKEYIWRGHSALQEGKVPSRGAGVGARLWGAPWEPREGDGGLSVAGGAWGQDSPQALQRGSIRRAGLPARAKAGEVGSAQRARLPGLRGGAGPSALPGDGRRWLRKPAQQLPERPAEFRGSWYFGAQSARPPFPAPFPLRWNPPGARPSTPSSATGDHWTVGPLVEWGVRVAMTAFGPGGCPLPASSQGVPRCGLNQAPGRAGGGGGVCVCMCSTETPKSCPPPRVGCCLKRTRVERRQEKLLPWRTPKGLTQSGRGVGCSSGIMASGPRVLARVSWP